jgi:hypothetical protein
MPSPDIIEKIQLRALTAQSDELYASIAETLPPGMSDQIGGGAALRLRSPVEFGREFYHKVLRPGLTNAICGKAKFCKNRKLYDTAAKVAGMVAEAAGDVVGKLNGIPVGGGEAGKLIVESSAAILREGLNSLCDCPEEHT